MSEIYADMNIYMLNVIEWKLTFSNLFLLIQATVLSNSLLFQISSILDTVASISTSRSNEVLSAEENAELIIKNRHNRNRPCCFKIL